MRTQFLSVSNYLCGALLGVLVVVSGCGGGKYADSSAGSGGMGDTPPVISSTNHWSTSFEASDQYSLGDITGQNGWEWGYHPTPEACSATVSNEMAVTGSQCLKLTYDAGVGGDWWHSVFELMGPVGAVPLQPLNSITFRLKVYRQPGESEYPAGSGTMHPNVWFNSFFYYPAARYVDFGDPAQDSKMHASLQNSTPRTWGDPGWEQIAGRFVDLVIYDNYLLGIRIVWYDGRKVATVPIYNPNGDYYRFILGYGVANPTVPAQLGKPMYIDDIDINWELAPQQ